MTSFSSVIRNAEDLKACFPEFALKAERPQKITSAKAGEFASSPTIDHHSDMNTVTRPEMDARLEAIEARMDGRVASMEAKLDSLIVQIEARDRVADERAKTSEARFDRVEADLTVFRSDIKSDTDNLRSSMGSLKTTIITTGVAIVLGVAAFNATVLSNMVASFESGKSTSKDIVQATEQLKQTQEQLKAIQERLERQAPQRNEQQPAK